MQKIEEIDLALPLAGSEGHDVNYISRIRTQYLFAQHQALLTQTQFADAKAAALMTLMGLLALRGPFESGEATANPIGLAFFAAVASSVLFAFLAVLPRYPGTKQRRRMAFADRWSWPALATDDFKADDYSRYMQTSEVSQLVHSIAISNASISSILLSKFRLLRTAFVFGLITLTIMAVRVAGAA